MGEAVWKSNFASCFPFLWKSSF